MIPKKIHYCWYGKGKMNKTIQKCIKSWKEVMPEYEFKIWDETNTPFDKFPFLKILYKQKKWSFITDYIRLYSIYTEGGIYLDTDIEVLKKFDSLLTEQAFLGFQTKLNESIYPLNSAVIGSVVGNKFILDCLKETENKQRLYYNAMGGPSIVTKIILKNYGLNTYKDQVINGVRILPTPFFYPFSWTEEFTTSCIKPETFAIHWWEDSWRNPKKGMEYFLDSLKRKIQKTPSIIINRFRYYILNKKDFYYIHK